MNLSDMKKARELLALNCAKADPFAVEYLDYDAFEAVLDAVMMAGGEADAIMQVFKASINKAKRMRAQDKTPERTN